MASRRRRRARLPPRAPRPGASAGPGGTGDHPGGRRFADVGPAASWRRGGSAAAGAGRLRDLGRACRRARDNAVLVRHALTGDSHVVGPAGPGHPTPGWWDGLVGPGRALDTDRWFVVALERARRLPGHHRAVVAGPRRPPLGQPVPVRHRARPGRRRGAAGRRPRHPRRGRLVRRRLHGRDAGAGVGRHPPGAGRAAAGAGHHRPDLRRPDRLVRPAARGDPRRPGVRAAATTTTRPGGTGPHPGSASPGRIAHTTYRCRGRARRAVRPVGPAGGGPARRRRALRRGVLPGPPRRQARPTASTPAPTWSSPRR